MEGPRVRACQQRHSIAVGRIIDKVGRSGLVQMNHERHSAIRIDTLA